MTSGKWVRVSRERPCPVCDHADWCGVSADGSVCICMRIAEGAVQQTCNGGWLHRLKKTGHSPGDRRIRKVGIQPPERLWVDFGHTAAEFSAAVNIFGLQDFAEELGLSVEGLVRLEIGWSAEDRAWSFPMRDAGLKVKGIRLRSWTGAKWAVTGSRDGLFIPTGLTSSGSLLVAEGPTDAAALLDLGFETVGRPNCTGGTRPLVRLVKRKRPEQVVIVADVDPHGAGRRGAESLATALLPYCPVRVIIPPPGIKDVREWKRAGATHDDVAARIEAAPVHKLVVHAQRSRRGRRRR